MELYYILLHVSVDFFLLVDLLPNCLHFVHLRVTATLQFLPAAGVVVQLVQVSVDVLYKIAVVL